MFCNTSEIAFGPVFGEDEDQLEFLDWYSKTLQSKFCPDVRKLGAGIIDAVDAWRKEVEENENEEAGMRASVDDGDSWGGGFAENN